MSRVGKKPIFIPEKTTVSYKDNVLTAKGAKGELSCTVHPSVDIDFKDNVIHVVTLKNKKSDRAMQGLVRSLIANTINGVSEGYVKTLVINGIGYRASLSDNTIVFNLGYSHPINFELSDGVSADIEKNNIIKLMGIDKEQLGHVAASIRRLRPPEPYKGKGIKYAEERLIKKAGKTGAK